MAALPLTVGVELEVCNVSRSCPDRANAHYRGRAVQEIGGWKFKTDASCYDAPGNDPGFAHGHKVGFELVSEVIYTEEGIETSISEVTSYLNKYGARVNDRCGMHVHVGVASFPKADVDRLLSFLVRYEDAFFALADDGRQSNVYCRRLSESLANRVRNGEGVSAWKEGYDITSNDRYSWLNGVSFSKFGTIEFRIQGGTLDKDTILGWTNFILHICDSVLNMGGKVFSRKSKSHVPAIALHDMLQRAGSYGKLITRCPRRAVLAREWAGAHFKSIHGTSHRAIQKSHAAARRGV